MRRGAPLSQPARVASSVRRTTATSSRAKRPYIWGSSTPQCMMRRWRLREATRRMRSRLPPRRTRHPQARSPPPHTTPSSGARTAATPACSLRSASRLRSRRFSTATMRTTSPLSLTARRRRTASQSASRWPRPWSRCAPMMAGRKIRRSPISTRRRPDPVFGSQILATLRRRSSAFAYLVSRRSRSPARRSFVPTAQMR